MKKFILSLLVLACTLPLSAQEPFEGVIKGRIYQSATGAGDLEIYIKGARVKVVNLLTHVEQIVDFEKRRQYIIFNNQELIYATGVMTTTPAELCEGTSTKEMLSMSCKLHTKQKDSPLYYSFVQRASSCAWLCYDIVVDEFVGLTLCGGTSYPAVALKYKITNELVNSKNDKSYSVNFEAFYATEVTATEIPDSHFEPKGGYEYITEDDLVKAQKKAIKMGKKEGKKSDFVDVKDVAEMIENMDAVWLF